MRPGGAQVAAAGGGGGATGGPHSLAGGAECNQTQVTGRQSGSHPSRAGLPTWMTEGGLGGGKEGGEHVGWGAKVVGSVRGIEGEEGGGKGKKKWKGFEIIGRGKGGVRKGGERKRGLNKKGSRRWLKGKGG